MPPLTWQQIAALGARLTPQLARAIATVLQQAQGRVPIAAIVELLRGLSPIDVQRVLSSLPALLMHAVTPPITAATAGAARLEHQGLGTSFAIDIGFALVNQHAVRAAQRQVATLVARITVETREAIRSVVASAVEHGLTVRQAAQLIKPAIGLTTRQAQAVTNFHARLVAAGAADETVQRQVDKYAGKLLTQRSITIARTETIDALVRGQHAIWSAGIEQGLIAPTAMQKWIITPDDRLCPYCKQMVGDKAIAPVGGGFATPLGQRMGPPMHPNCRCAVRLVPGTIAPAVPASLSVARQG